MAYINDRQFTKELIISSGRGKLTKKGEELIIKLAYHLFRTHKRMIYLSQNIYYEDICSGGIMAGLLNWKKFNHKKYDSAFAYMTEVVKRGQTAVYNKVILNKDWSGEAHSVISYDFQGLYDKKRD